MPLFYNPDVTTQKGKVTIIPHRSKFEKYSNHFPNVIDTYTSDWRHFIDEIASSEKVISSSLHGIILAESYGTPAIMLNDYPGTIFKYKDYYMSTGRDIFPMADSVEEALNMDGEVNPILEQMQRKLLESFPKDIF